MKKTFLGLILSVTSLAGQAGQVYVNGKTYTCNGNIQMYNEKVLCDGVEISKPAAGQALGVCGGGVEVKRFVNFDGSEGGLVSKYVTFEEAKVFIDKDSSVCGPVALKGLVIIRNSNLNGGGIIKGLGLHGVTIEKAQLNGIIDIEGDGVEARDMQSSGQLKMRDQAKIYGGIFVGSISLDQDKTL